MSSIGNADVATHREANWLIEQIDEFNDARLCGDEERQREVFLQVVNRCAQLSRWADLHTPDHLNVPANNDPCWATLAKAGHV